MNGLNMLVGNLPATDYRYTEHSFSEVRGQKSEIRRLGVGGKIKPGFSFAVFTIRVRQLT